MVNLDREIISAMINSAECASRGCMECELSDFTDTDCKRIFARMLTMHAAGTPIDLITVCNAFDADPGFVPTVCEISSTFVTTVNFATWIELIKQRTKFRVFGEEMNRCMLMAREESPDTFDEAADVLAKVQAIGSSGVSRIGIDAVTAVIEVGEKTTAIPTGFKDLDAMIGGFYAGNLMIVAGRPSMGKSSLAVNFAKNLCQQGKTVAIFTLEDSKKSVARRMAYSMARASAKDIRNGDSYKCGQILKAGTAIGEYKLYINDRGIQTAQTIRSDCYKIKSKEHALDLVIVDYLGLIKTREKKNGTRQQEIGEVTRAMKLLAKDLNTTVVLVSQLNRGVESRESKKPVMSDLRESGDIEQDADVILFPFRPFVYVPDAQKNAMSNIDREIAEREAWFVVAKNRNGITGDLRVVWIGEHYLFMEAASK